ncbi:hypothetical protein B7463_g6729, partial [Scytalidium lignicola]
MFLMRLECYTDSGARCSRECPVDADQLEPARSEDTVEEGRVLVVDTRSNVAAVAAVAAAELVDGVAGARCSRGAGVAGDVEREDPVARGEDDAAWEENRVSRWTFSQ